MQTSKKTKAILLLFSLFFIPSFSTFVIAQGQETTIIDGDDILSHFNFYQYEDYL